MKLFVNIISFDSKARMQIPNSNISSTFYDRQVTWQTPVGVSTEKGKYFLLNQRATFTMLISTGTSTSGPITAANACPESRPKTATATAIANSKLLDAAVKLNVVDCS